jgi:hypothetical protein
MMGMAAAVSTGMAITMLHSTMLGGAMTSCAMRRRRRMVRMPAMLHLGLRR